MKRLVLVVFMFIAQSAFAGVIQGGFGRTNMLTYGVAVDDHLKEQSEEILSPALALVRLTLTQPMPTEQGSGPKFDFIIQVTDRKTLASKDKDNPSLNKFTNGLTGDAYSFLLADQPGSPVIVRILWDEIMYENRNGTSVERPDGFTRLLAALGHEIFGNVRNFINRRSFFESPAFLYSEEVRRDEYRASEVRAFTAGRDFLEMVIAQLRGVLPGKTIRDLEQALDREKEMLAYHVGKLQDSRGTTSAQVIPFNASEICQKNLLK